MGVLVREQFGTGVHVLMSKWSEVVCTRAGSGVVSGRFLEVFDCSGGGGMVRGGSIVRATCGGLWSGGSGTLYMASIVSRVGSIVSGCGGDVEVVAGLSGFAIAALVS